MSSDFSLLNSIGVITLVQNNVNELHTLTINSIDYLQGQIYKINTNTDSNILLNSKQDTFIVALNI